MRSLPQHGSTIGGVGLYLLAATNTEMLIADVRKKKCRDCGQLLATHSIVGNEARCPTSD